MKSYFLSAILVIAFSTPAFAQFGGGGGFGGGFGGSDGNSVFIGAESSDRVESQNLMIAISKSGKSVYGFSTVTGKVAVLKLEEKVTTFTPVVSGNVACLVNGKSVHAFSAKTGQWNSTDVANNGATPIVSNNLVVLTSGKSAYAFGAANGKWIQVEVPEDAFPSISFSMTKIVHGSKIFICSETSTAWQVIDLEVDE